MTTNTELTLKLFFFFFFNTQTRFSSLKGLIFKEAVIQRRWESETFKI